MAAKHPVTQAVLMHGDREVSTRSLARQVGARSTRPCAPEVAELVRVLAPTPVEAAVEAG